MSLKSLSFEEESLLTGAEGRRRFLKRSGGRGFSNLDPGEPRGHLQRIFRPSPDVAPRVGQRGPEGANPRRDVDLRERTKTIVGQKKLAGKREQAVRVFNFLNRAFR